METIPASVLILTRNSASTLPRALASVRAFGEILVADGNSIDETIRIAEVAGARIVPQSPECLDPGGVIRDFACVRNACLREAKYDWILALDSDESASEGLVAEIQAFLAGNPPPSVGRVPAGIVLDGAPIRYSSNYPGYQRRFFNRNAGRYRKPVHERFEARLGAPIVTFRHPWHYYLTADALLREEADDLARDRDLFRERYRGATFAKRWRGSKGVARSIMSIAVKSFWNAAAHPGRSTMPLRFEWHRLRYQLRVLAWILFS